MVIKHKKNTAYYLAVPMVDSSTPESFKSGVVVVGDGYYKDGAGAWTVLILGDFTEIGTTGIYEITLEAAILNHDFVIIKLTASGAADSFVIFEMEVSNITEVNAKLPEAFNG